jgi:hypothetical protein
MGGFINDIDTFDSLAFGISKNEAEYMDPSLRVALEVAHQVRYLDCCFPVQNKFSCEFFYLKKFAGSHRLWDRLQRF